MSTQQHHIPALPKRPSVRPLAFKIHRSYPVGRSSYSRAFQGHLLSLSITIDGEPSPNVQVNLLTTMNSADGKSWSKVLFTRADINTWICQLKPEYPGLHSFRAEFSLDEGVTWIRDTVADAWVLVDPIQIDGLRLYTLIPNVSGTISDWISELNRIHAMGFNAVHLLPLTTLDTSESPYSARDLFQVDPRYLDPHSPMSGLSQLEAFVEAAKKLNIKLCFDLVLNHVGVHSTIAAHAPDWIVSDPNQPDGFQRARYLTDTGWFFWDDLILINYEHPSEAIRSEIWAYMTSYMLFWAKFAHLTGGFIRFDNLHSSNPHFVQSLTDTLHQVYPDVAILAEYFTDETTLIQTGLKWRLNLKLATPWDYKFVPKLREYLKNIHRLSRYLRFFMPVTSHDSGSPAQEFGSAESTVPRYVAAALLGTGATGIVQGVEFGIREKVNFIGRMPKMQYPENPLFVNFISKVNSLLADFPVFRQSGNCKFVDNGHHAVIAAFRQELGFPDEGFLVVCNFDILGAQNISIDLGSILGTGRSIAGTDLLGNEVFTFSGTRVDFHLESCSAKVLKVTGI